MPKVSVIIPNYNHAAFLKQRIDSVLNQTFNDFELVILDDCSTDNSREIIEQYSSNSKVSRIIYNTENSGNPFKQWEKGIELATGEYIWIAESDDWCENNLLDTLVTGIENDSHCILGYCQSYCVSDTGRIKFQSNHPQLSEYIDGKSFIKNYMLPKNPIFNAGMAVWKKEAYLQISRDYTTYKLMGDYFFWIELCTCGNVFVSGKLLNYFRVHDTNVSSNSVKYGLSFTEQIPLLKNLLERKIIEQKDYLKSLKSAYSMFRFQQKNLPKENADAVKKLFASYTKAKYKLKIYFIQKYIQLHFKKLIKA